MPRHFKTTKAAPDFHIPSGKETYGNCSLNETTFDNSSNAAPKLPVFRPTIRNVTINRMHHWACSAYGVIFENISICDVRGGGRAPSFFNACAFSNVVIRGWFGGCMIKWEMEYGATFTNNLFARANNKFHNEVEFSLDIKEAKFTTYGTLIGIPASTIKRDPERHFIMNRKSAQNIILDNPKFSLFKISAEELIKSPFEDTTIIVGDDKRSESDFKIANELRQEDILQ